MDPLLLENQLCFPLYACARKVTQVYTPILKPLGLTYTQYLVLLVLWEKDGVSVGHIGERLYLDTGTLTPLLKKMEKAGWLVRGRSEEDERRVFVHLTESGHTLREKALTIPIQVSTCTPLEGEEARCLYNILYKILRYEPNEKGGSSNGSSCDHEGEF